MYYPSRISQLISEKDAELDTIDDCRYIIKELLFYAEHASNASSFCIETNI